MLLLIEQCATRVFYKLNASLLIGSLAASACKLEFAVLCRYVAAAHVLLLTPTRCLTRLDLM